jgi:hypothetical protein
MSPEAGEVLSEGRLLFVAFAAEDPHHQQAPQTSAIFPHWTQATASPFIMKAGQRHFSHRIPLTLMVVRFPLFFVFIMVLASCCVCVPGFAVA